MRKLLSGLLLSLIFLLAGCQEAKEGADAVSGKVTGEQDIENMKKTAKKLKNLQKKTNKQQQEAIKELEN